MMPCLPLGENERVGDGVPRGVEIGCMFSTEDSSQRALLQLAFRLSAIQSAHLQSGIGGQDRPSEH